MSPLTIIQSGGFFAVLTSKLGGPFMKVVVPVAKNVMLSLGLTEADSPRDAEIKKCMTWLVKKYIYVIKELNQK